MTQWELGYFVDSIHSYKEAIPAPKHENNKLERDDAWDVLTGGRPSSCSGDQARAVYALKKSPE